jgi:hypothetical protein
VSACQSLETEHEYFPLISSSCKIHYALLSKDDLDVTVLQQGSLARARDIERGQDLL